MSLTPCTITPLPHTSDMLCQYDPLFIEPSSLNLCMATPTLAHNWHAPSWPGGDLCRLPATTQGKWLINIHPLPLSLIPSTTSSSPTSHHCQHTQPPKWPMTQTLPHFWLCSHN